MATTIPHRELRNNSSDILRRVQSGETFEITNHGEVVAVLSPPGSVYPPGLRVRLATNHAPFSEIVGVKVDETVQEMLDDLRGER